MILNIDFLFVILCIINFAGEIRTKIVQSRENLLVHSESLTEKLLQTQPESVCDDGWLQHESKCYFIERMKTKKDVAQKICSKVHGAILAPELPNSRALKDILFTYSANEPIRLKEKCEDSNGDSDCDKNDLHSFLCEKRSQKDVFEEIRQIKNELENLEEKYTNLDKSLTEKSKTVKQLKASIDSFKETENKLTSIDVRLESIIQTADESTKKFENELRLIRKQITPGDSAFRFSAPVKIRRTPLEREIKVKSGDALELKCEHSAFPEPLIIWKHNGEEITSCGNRTSCKLDDIIPAQRGTYSCLVDNDVGFHKLEWFDVIITFKPTIQFEKYSYFANIGEDLQIQATVEGYPKPTLKWIHNHFTQLSSQITTQENDKTLTFTITKITKSQLGTYTLRAENECGTTKAEIVVKGSPPRNIQIHEPNIYREEDVLKCNITA